jgi:hypothetical protein
LLMSRPVRRNTRTLCVIAVLLKIYLVWSHVLDLLHELKKKILFGDDILLFVAVFGLASFS